MSDTGLDAVTGVLGLTGREVTKALLERGRGVRSLLREPDLLSNDGMVEGRPLDFLDPAGLIESLRGVDTLYNTYWVRFERGGVGYVEALVNTEVLLGAAERAGVRRVVQVSIVGADVRSDLPYFRGKGRVEEAVRKAGVSHAIVRPTLLFGAGDILVNNLVWFLRRFPVFWVAGDGSYRVRPVYVGDLAGLMVAVGRLEQDVEIRAVGPEVYEFRELAELVGRTVGSGARVMGAPAELVYCAGWLTGKVMRDVVLTREELEGLRRGYLWADGAPTGETKLSEWLWENREVVGMRYVSELLRHW